MSELRYTDEHEWVRLEGEIATVGISDFAQEQLGDVVYVDMPAIGTYAIRDEEIVVVESVKAASEVYAPVSGDIVEINELLEENPGLVNESAEDAGWFLRIRANDPSEVQSLMSGLEYAEYVKSIS